MKKFLILLVLVLALVAGFWCWQQQKSEPPPAVVQPTVAMASEVRMRLPTFALMLNPLKMSEVESRRVATLLHSGLVAVDQKGAVSARLAKSWAQDAAGTWQFELRDDVTFSDGQKADANAAVSSLCASMQPSSPWAWALESIKHEVSSDGKSVICSGLVALSSMQLQIEQSVNAPWLINALASPAGWVIANAATEQPYGVLPGIGPYAVDLIVADTEVVLKKRDGGVLTAGVDKVVFDYLPDSAIAAARFAQGKLDALDIDSPAVSQQLFASAAPVWNFSNGVAARVETAPAERVRVVIVNEQKLTKLGFTAEQIDGFKAQYEAALDRNKITSVSRGLAEPMLGSTLLAGAQIRAANNTALPSADLVLNMEPDAYSDVLAASLPTVVGNVKLRYQGLDKGLLIGNLIKGEYDIMLMVIENPVQSDAFYAALFTKGNPFSAFGKGIAEASEFDLLTKAGTAAAAARIDAEGNWIGVIREPRVMALSNRLQGIYFSPSGQPNLEAIRLR